MLQNIFYVVVITQSVISILVLLAILLIVWKLYSFITDTIRQINEKASAISDVVSEVGERGGDLLRMATKEGQSAISASTVMSILMHTYFFGKTIRQVTWHWRAVQFVHWEDDREVGE